MSNPADNTAASKTSEAPRPWPTDDLIIIHKGQDLGSGERVAPGTVALRDSEGDYFTRNYGFLCKHIDKIDNWTPIDPRKKTP
jgi:hypothetical protein